MTLAPGTRFGSYEALASLGAGGMGEVYRARDLQLKREVALKILPAALASDAERLARFQREAEILASLNHSNIAHIYGIADADPAAGAAPARALVMELVEGPTLADRIVLGTAAYMSPEQARGRAVDARADIWSFGCVVFEMLTGRSPFAGESITDVLGAIVHKEPESPGVSWSARC